MNPLSLASALTNLRAAESLGRIQLAVAARMLKTSDEHGQAVAQLVESAAEAIEQSAGQVVALTADLGGSLDLTA
ncbi:MAG: hypothetical protein ACYSVY_00555 [Planctomycetota bacterium]|jgi:hypothetical protein